MDSGRGIRQSNGTANLSSRSVRDLAAQCGFDIAGIASPGPVADFERYRSWIDRGNAGEMRYLTDHRSDLRHDPETLLPGVKSIICVGLIYNGPEPYSTDFSEPERAWISRYAWGDDYHDIMRARLEVLVGKLLQLEEFSWRACVDTAPLLERSLAREAGLGWIGRNTCLINQQVGSWFFLGELLTTLELTPDTPPPDRCGTCTRCIEACPTEAIAPSPSGGFELVANRCISYFTIELRSSIPDEMRGGMGNQVFGCDICQDVCPWNRKALKTTDKAFFPREFAPPLDRLAGLSEDEFRTMFKGSPTKRSRYSGFLRNVAVAMGNAGLEKFREPLTKLAGSPDLMVAEHAQWALGRLTP